MLAGAFSMSNSCFLALSWHLWMPPAMDAACVRSRHDDFWAHSTVLSLSAAAKEGAIFAEPGGPGCDGVMAVGRGARVRAIG